jgi:TonB family protein
MFQEALIESLPHGTRRVRAYLASVSLHAAVLAALAWISLQAVGELGEPPETIIYRVGFNPPPLGDGGSGRSVAIRQHPTTRLRPLLRSDVFQPVRATETEHRDAHSREIFERLDSEVDGQTGNDGKPGDGSGLVGGTGDKPVKKTGDGEIYEVSKTPGLISPVLLSRVDPLYPETARKLHLSGIVVLQAVIDASGRIVDLRVLKSAGELLDAAAIAAVGRWIYRPATLNGRAVNVSLSVNVDFKLH